MDFPSLSEAGIEASSTQFEGQDGITQVGGDFLGIVVRQPVGSFASFVTDERPVGRAGVPITLLLQGRPIFEFPFEALGLPSAF
jgi:hypothetical protein